MFYNNSSLKIGDFYILTNPAARLGDIDGVILDNNFLVRLFNWYLGDPRKKNPKVQLNELETKKALSEEMNRHLLPIIRTVRERELSVVWGLAALERSWTNDTQKLNYTNYNKVNVQIFIKARQLIDTLFSCDQDKFEEYIASACLKNLLPDPASALTPSIKYLQAKSFPDDMISIWAEVLLLLIHLSKLEKVSSVDVRIEKYRAWQEDVFKSGLPRFSVTALLAYFGFFEAKVPKISHDDDDFIIGMHEKDGAGKARYVDSESLLKKKDRLGGDKWSCDGLAKISRNIAQDLYLFSAQNQFRSGMYGVEDNDKTISGPMKKMGIVTADGGMHGLNLCLRGDVPGPYGLNTISIDLPSDSGFRQEYPEESDRNRLSDLRTRPPKELASHKQIKEILFDLFNSPLAQPCRTSKKSSRTN